MPGSCIPGAHAGRAPGSQRPERLLCPRVKPAAARAAGCRRIVMWGAAAFGHEAWQATGTETKAFGSVPRGALRPLQPKPKPKQRTQGQGQQANPPLLLLLVLLLLLPPLVVAAAAGLAALAALAPALALRALGLLGLSQGGAVGGGGRNRFEMGGAGPPAAGCAGRSTTTLNRAAAGEAPAHSATHPPTQPTNHHAPP